MSFELRAPASSANLGSGFDSLALALDLWLHVTVTPDDGEGIRPVGEPDLLGGENLVILAMRRAAQAFDLTLPACTVRVESEIPVARGLGSSAAAIVAGIRAAVGLAGGQADEPAIINLAAGMEGHADNAAAAALGGVIVAVATDAGYVAARLVRTFRWQPVLFIPESASLTSVARGILPAEVPLADAAANVGRAALLVHALTSGRGDLLREAMTDRLHQPYRRSMFPHLDPVVAAAIEAGAEGACLSGAGPAVLALADEGVVRDVASAMVRAGEGVEVRGSTAFPGVARHGVEIVTRPRLTPTE